MQTSWIRANKGLPEVIHDLEPDEPGHHEDQIHVHLLLLAGFFRLTDYL